MEFTDNTPPEEPAEKVDKESSPGNDNGGGGCEDPDTLRAMGKGLTESAKTDNRVATALDPAVAGLARSSGQSSTAGKPGTLPESQPYPKGYQGLQGPQGTDPEDGGPDEMKFKASVGVVNAASARTGHNYQPPAGEDGPSVPDPRASDVKNTSPMIGDDGQPTPPPTPE